MLKRKPAELNHIQFTGKKRIIIRIANKAFACKTIPEMAVTPTAVNSVIRLDRHEVPD